ncbi:APC family permease [candidate division KSB1 bacterium]|nr:APC family permease [candidate division KSB1 bacterium]
MSQRTSDAASTSAGRTGLSREMGLLGLAATGICSMLGAAINVIPFIIQRNVPGIGPHVLPAYLFAAVPAILAALAYAILASAMPRAGGSYVYASRALNPYLGFVASFSQWFGLSIAIGVVSYVLVPFLRDIAAALGWQTLASALDSSGIRLTVALAFLWTFVAVNLRGVQLYERTLVPLMFLMFALGAVVIVAGFYFDQQDFAAAVLEREGRQIAKTGTSPLQFGTFLAAAALLFSSFIGFDSIAQAGGEARNPGRTLPLAIGIAVVTVGTFYMLFTAAVYHAVPWTYIAEEAMKRDLTAPGLLGYLLPAGWTVAIVSGAAVALTNDLPAMLLAVSRLMFAWAEDGIFPRRVASVHPKWHTPHVAIVLSGLMATAGILGSHLAGDFFLGVDILVTSMLVNFLLMCVSVLALPRRNPEIAREVRVLPSRRAQVPLALLGTIVIGGFLIVHVWKDFTASVSAWYFHSTPVWLAVMAVATAVYLRELRNLRRSGVDVEAIFSTLPPE